MCLTDTVKQRKRSSSGIGIQMHKTTLYSLHFVHDQIVIAQDWLRAKYEQRGLNINATKTKYMCVGGRMDNAAFKNGKILSKCPE